MEALDRISASKFIQGWYDAPEARIGAPLVGTAVGGTILSAVMDIGFHFPLFFLGWPFVFAILVLVPLLAKRHGMHKANDSYRGINRVRNYLDLSKEEKKQLPPNMLDMLGWDDGPTNRMFDKAIQELYALRNHFYVDNRAAAREVLENALKDIEMTRKTYDELA